MADESRNPGDNAEQARLNAELRGLKGDLAREARELDAQSKRREVKKDEQLAREERVVRERKKPAPGVPAEDPGAAERVARATRERADAEERIRQAQRNRLLPAVRGQALPLGEGAYGATRLNPADAIRAYGQAIQRQQPWLSSDFTQRATSAVGSAARPYVGSGAPVPRDPAVRLRDVINGQQRKAADEFAKRQDDVRVKTNAARVALDDESLALRRSAVGYEAASQSLRRHGALTTEFISAAARGQTTISELGFQVGSTIGKFAGWTAAASAVFGVVAALGRLGRGAIDSSTGVNQLHRVIADVNAESAQSGFRDLSRQFNLPIATVADAQYQLGKTYGDQNKALAATPALLAAVKVGELSVADAARFLQSTTRAYNLEASDLLPLLDQFNSLQNNMGVSIRDTAAGVAKASGQFRAAGGDLKQLVAIVGAGTRVTGLSGDQFGTLLQRSAALVSRPKNKEALKSFGIDPEADITTIYENAFKIARKLSGRQRLQLAEALSTPQLAPRLTALLGRSDVYQQALKLVDPARAAGSAYREAAVQLGSVQERIARIGTDLEQLGSAISSSGGLIVPGAFVTGLDHSLRLSTGILGTWAKLPTPITHTATSLLEVLAILRLIQHFNVGDAIAGRAPELGRLFSQSPEKRARGLVGQGLQAEQSFLRDELERTRRQGTIAQAEVLAGTHRIGLPNTPGLSEEAVLVENEARLEAVNNARRRAVALEQQDAALTAELNRSIERTNRFKSEVIRKRRLTPAQFAEQEGVYVVNDIARPTTSPPTNQLPVLGEGLYQQRLARARQGATDLGRGARIATATTAAADTAWIVASRNVGGLARATGSLAGRLARSIGPFGGLVAASFLLPEAYQLISDQTDKAAKTLDEIRAAKDKGYSPRDLKTAIDKATHDAKRSASLGETISNFLHGSVFGPTINSRGTVTPQAQDVRRGAAEETRRALLDRQLRQTSAIVHGGPIPEQTLKQIDDRRRSDLDAFKHGTITESELHRRLQKRLEEYRLSLEAGRGEDKRTQRAIDDTKRFEAQAIGGRGPGGLADLFRGLNNQQIGTAISTYTSLAADDDFAHNLQIARAGLRVLEGKLKGDKSPEALQRLAQARKTISDAVEQHYARLETLYDSRTDLLQSETTDPVAQARILVDRLRAKAQRVLERYRRGNAGLDAVNGVNAQVNRALQAVDAAQLQDFQADQQLGDARFGLAHIGDQGAVLKHAISDAQKLIAKVRGLAHRPSGSLRDATKALLEAQTAYGEFLQQQAQAMAEAQTQYDLAGVDDPVKRATIQLRADRRLLAFQKTPADRLQQQAKIRQDRFDLARTRNQDAFDTIEFEAQMGRIDRETEIKRLQMLVGHIKGMRDLKRQIQLRIHELKNQSDQNDIELNVGNIRLPTVYDVRRLARQGTDNNPTVVHAEINVHGVGDPGSVADIVVGRMSTVINGSLRSKTRALA